MVVRKLPDFPTTRSPCPSTPAPTPIPWFADHGGPRVSCSSTHLQSELQTRAWPSHRTVSPAVPLSCPCPLCCLLSILRPCLGVRGYFCGPPLPPSPEYRDSPPSCDPVCI